MYEGSLAGVSDLVLADGSIKSDQVTFSPSPTEVEVVAISAVVAS